jgi:hypothetical protein
VISSLIAWASARSCASRKRAINYRVSCVVGAVMAMSSLKAGLDGLLMT